jgi:hypothetical protein
MKSTILILLFAGRMTAETLVLKRAWVEQYKDRATIDAAFTIDHAHKKANAATADGDMHVAGRAPKEVGLPMVAEMMNAAGSSQKATFDLIHQNEGNQKASPITGAWRLWFEHPAAAGQTQFAAVPPAANTNPDHSFEIHPITNYAGQDVSGSVDFVPGFAAHDARSSFGSYEKMSISVRATATAVSMDAKKSGFNYAKFRMKLRAAPTKLDDGGLAVIADVLDDQDPETVLASKVRMIFAKGTGPWTLIKGAAADSEFDALGIPRVNLNAISTFLKAAGSAASTRKLPYEMIVVGLKAAE